MRLDAFEQQLREQVAPRMLQVYGIEIRQVGVERMTLPDETLAATVARMRAERETVAAERTADGLRQAAAIRADADRDAREVVAQAREQAPHTEADAQQAAARIYAKAYQSDPGLYTHAALARLARPGARPQYQSDPAHRCRAVPGAGRWTRRQRRAASAASPSRERRDHAESSVRRHDPVGTAAATAARPDRAVGGDRLSRGLHRRRCCCVLLWLTSNVREIASDSQAVVLRFGRIVRSQEAGLLIAWPRPIEQVRMLPGPERQLTQEIAPLAAGERAIAGAHRTLRRRAVHAAECRRPISPATATWCC